ncbi:MAG: hypothetical protein AAGF91_16895 [Actinomycetota bacterium]
MDDDLMDLPSFPPPTSPRIAPPPGEEFEPFAVDLRIPPIAPPEAAPPISSESTLASVGAEMGDGNGDEWDVDQWNLDERGRVDALGVPKSLIIVLLVILALAGWRAAA